jgi:hypothetical protein
VRRARSDAGGEPACEAESLVTTPATSNRLEFRSSPRVFAPDWAERMRSIPAPAWLLVAVFLLVLIAHDPRGTAWATTLLVVLVLFGGPVLMKSVNTRVIVTPEHVECRDALRRVRTTNRSTLSALVIIRIQMLGPRFVLTRVLMIDSNRRVHCNLQVDAWSDDQLRHIYRALALPVTEAPTALRPHEANREYPGAASPVLRYWPLVALAGFLTAGAILSGVLFAIGRG